MFTVNPVVNRKNQIMSDNPKTQDENKLIAERRAKLTALREQGKAFPNDFRRNVMAGGTARPLR